MAALVVLTSRALLAAFAHLVITADCLILESGQRIAPLPQPPLKSTTAWTTNDDKKTSPRPTTTASLLDLPAVERWATSEHLSERHVKTLYRVLLRSTEGPSTLFQRLLDHDFPKKAAVSLLLHNDQYKFVECTSRVVSASPSQRGYKLAIQFDGETGPIVETVLIRHVVDSSNGGKEDKSSGNSKRESRCSSSVTTQQRYTVCLSCQVGCARACTFCETGTMGLRGNLSSGQILEQVLHAERYLQKQTPPTENGGAGGGGIIRNVVFMGMGEATDAYESVHEACRGLTHQCLFGLAAKQITISTVGAAPERIKSLADDMPGVSLALSLHGATQELREELIPSARGISGSTIEDLAEALDYHAERTGRGVMIEYLLIQNVNDSEEAADALGRFCLERQRNQRSNTQGTKGRHSSVTYINLIPYNPTAAGDRFSYVTPSEDTIDAFASRLRDRFGVRTLVRWSSADGRDANGACGQLAISSEKGFDRGGG